MLASCFVCTCTANDKVIEDHYIDASGNITTNKRQAACSAGLYIIAYEHIYEGGQRLYICAGGENFDLGGTFWNNRISSIFVPRGWAIQLFDSRNLAGPVVRLGSCVNSVRESDLRYLNFNDKTTSFDSWPMSC